MQNVLNLYKPIGITPLQLVDLFKEKHPGYREVKLGYAGRLDPMADGVLLVLVGDENKKRKKYEALEKTYSFDCLFGIATDTADILGIITKTTPDVFEKEITTRLPNILVIIKQQTLQQYPAYSSRTVNGKPLYYYARKNLLDEITIPSHPIAIHKLSLQNNKLLPSNQLQKYIFENIQKVKGDFRQKEIFKGWKKFFRENASGLIVAHCLIRCSSGTYVRSICEEIGNQLGVGGMALRITRESVGGYSIRDSLKI